MEKKRLAQEQALRKKEAEERERIAKETEAKRQAEIQKQKEHMLASLEVEKRKAVEEELARQKKIR